MGAILAIETATRVCSVAVAEGSEVLGEFSLNVPQVHVERLVILIDELLSGLHRAYSDIEAIAVSNGPGSFTGLRIGLSVAKGIAYGKDKKLIAVPTLDALALRFIDVPEGTYVVPLLHARAEEFYYARFKKTGGRMQKIGEYAIAEAAKIAGESTGDTLFVGEGAAAFAEHEEVRKKFGFGSFKKTLASATEIALLAEEKRTRGEFADLKTLAPHYIKDFVAIKGNPLKKIVEKN